MTNCRFVSPKMVVYEEVSPDKPRAGVGFLSFSEWGHLAEAFMSLHFIGRGDAGLNGRAKTDHDRSLACVLVGPSFLVDFG